MAIVGWDPLRMMRWPNVWDWDDNDLVPSIGGDNLDVFETADEVTVRANVAGVDPAKVDITFEKGVLWIRGEETEETKEGKKFYRKASRSYSYKIAIPGDIDVNKEPVARVDQGLVTISFKKAEQAKPKKISIKAK